MTSRDTKITEYEGMSPADVPLDIAEAGGIFGFYGQYSILFDKKPSQKFIDSCEFEYKDGVLLCFRSIEVIIANESVERRLPVWIMNNNVGTVPTPSKEILQRLAVPGAENPAQFDLKSVLAGTMPLPRPGSQGSSDGEPAETLIVATDGFREKGERNVAEKNVGPSFTLPSIASVSNGPLPFESSGPPKVSTASAMVALSDTRTVQYTTPHSIQPRWLWMVDFDNKYVVAGWVAAVMVVFSAIVAVVIVHRRSSVQSTPIVTPITYPESDSGR